MNELNQIKFPNENDEYRTARNTLLQAEIDLRVQIENVASQRRKLPLGGKIKENYAFKQEDGSTTTISELFLENKNTLAIYSFMYGPNMENACPSCTCILDSFNGSSPHINQRVNFVVVAKSPIQRIMDWANTRGWDNLKLLSSEENTYNSDYFGETEEGAQMPMLNIFTKTEDGIFHTYASEMLFAPSGEGQDPRHVDALWPVWNLFDLTPEGRGKDWYPALEY